MATCPDRHHASRRSSNVQAMAYTMATNSHITPKPGQLTSVYHSAHTLGPWPGFGVMCLFVAIVYAIAWTLLDRRDA